MVGYYREGVVGLKSKLGMGRCCVVVKVRRGKKKVQRSARRALCLPYRLVHRRVSDEIPKFLFPRERPPRRALSRLLSSLD